MFSLLVLQRPEEAANLQKGSLLGFISRRISAKDLTFACLEETCPRENSFSYSQEAYDERRRKKERAGRTTDTSST